MTMCSLCRRHLLSGERYRHWEPGESSNRERPVCGLCEEAAARSGWVLTAQPARREGAGGPRATVRLVA
ncbi:MAG: hypothetical protein IT201_11015 [Thermoleophilia bacterium]|nr:hypothetical protein [Thermoleophilia bacterium]